MRKVGLSVSAAIALILVTFVWAAPSAGPVLSIGAVYPTGGPQGLQGTQELRGAELAVDWANDHGGAHGRSIRLDLAAADGADAVPSAMADLQSHGISIVLGSHASAISAAAAEQATTRGMLLWETGAVGTVDPSVRGDTNFFRMSPSGTVLGSSAISFLADEVLPRLPNPNHPIRWAVAYVDDAFGTAVGQGALGELQSLGLTEAGAFPYDAATTNFSALADQIGATHPDVLFVAAYVDDGVALRRAMVAEQVPLLASAGTSSSYCTTAFGDALGNDAVGLFASDTPDAGDVRASALLPEGRRALAWVTAQYKARWHSAPSAHALEGFSGAYALLVHVLPRAKEFTVADVAEAARNTTLPIGTLANGGGMQFAAPSSADPGDNLLAANVIWEWVAPDQRAVVWPPAMETHSIVAVPLGT